MNDLEQRFREEILARIDGHKEKGIIKEDAMVEIKITKDCRQIDVHLPRDAFVSDSTKLDKSSRRLDPMTLLSNLAMSVLWVVREESLCPKNFMPLVKFWVEKKKITTRCHIHSESRRKSLPLVP